jgi:hypothetical protein
MAIWFLINFHSYFDTYLMELNDYETHNQNWNLIPESWKRSDKSVTLVISRTQECKNHSHIQAENLEWYYSITT